MDYYFPKDFKFDRDYFSVTKIEGNTLARVLTDSLSWFVERGLFTNRETEKFHWWVYQNTLQNVDILYEQGIFYHHWLNAYLGQVANMVWVHTYDESRPSMKEKDACKLADSKRKEFTDFAKKKWI